MTMPETKTITYKFRAALSRGGNLRLNQLCRIQRDIYNELAESAQQWRREYAKRITAWQAGAGIALHWARRNNVNLDGRVSTAKKTHDLLNTQVGLPRPTEFDMKKKADEIRRAMPEGQHIPNCIARGPAKRLASAIDAFYGNRSQGWGFPGRAEWNNTIEFDANNSHLRRANNGDILIKLLAAGKKGSSRKRTTFYHEQLFPTIRVSRRQAERMPSDAVVKRIRVTRASAKQVWVQVVCNIPAKVAKAHFGRKPRSTVGIDKGITKRFTLSDHKRDDTRPDDGGVYSKLQRRIARAQEGSNNYKRLLAQARRHKRKETIRNINEDHRITTAIVREYGGIAVEALRLKSMTKSAKGTIDAPGKNVKAKRGLNRSMLRQSHGRMNAMLGYKADHGGRDFKEVEPAYTSLDCSSCGQRNPKSSRKGVSFECASCGYSADADYNAAVNIHNKAFGPVEHGPSGKGVVPLPGFDAVQY